MTTEMETRDLHRALTESVELAQASNLALRLRYDLLREKRPSTWKARITRAARQLAARLGLEQPVLTQFAWLPTLKHAPAAEGARPLLVWAEGSDKDAQRRSCEGLSVLLKDDPRWVPVLVTDVADFAFYSRLGWLVEYLPEIAGGGVSFRKKKKQYLVWRYKTAVVVPVSAGALSRASWENLLAHENCC